MNRLLAITVIAIAIGQAVTSAQSAPTKPRVIWYGVGRTIAEQLLPTDEVVVVERIRDAAVPVSQPLASSIIRNLVRESHAIAVVRADELIPFLSDQGQWIRTRIEGVVENVLVDKVKSLSTGGRIELQFSDGEMTIGRVLVKAGDAPKVQPGMSYLCFIWVEDKAFFSTYSPLRIEQGRLFSEYPFAPATEFVDPLNGLSLEAVIAEMRSLR